MLTASILINIVFLLLILALVADNFMDAKKIKTLEGRLTIPKPEPVKPPEPVFRFGSNADGQLSMWHDNVTTGARYAVTFWTPWSATRQESRDMALDILRHQGVEGIEAAKTLMVTNDKTD